MQTTTIDVPVPSPAVNPGSFAEALLAAIPGPAPLTPAEEVYLKSTCYRCHGPAYPDGSWAPRCRDCAAWEADPRNAGRLDEPGRPAAGPADLGEFEADPIGDDDRAWWLAQEIEAWEARERAWDDADDVILDDALYCEREELARIRELEHEAIAGGYGYE